MNALDILVPQTKRAKLFGREIEIGPLTLGNTIKLARAIARAKASIDHLPKDAGDAAVLAELLACAGADGAADIISALTGAELGAQEREKILYMPLAEAAALMQAVCEVNDFPALGSAFSSALETLKGRTPSPAQ